jgi:hypothetical protein
MAVLAYCYFDSMLDLLDYRLTFPVKAKRWLHHVFNAAGVSTSPRLLQAKPELPLFEVAYVLSLVTWGTAYLAWAAELEGTGCNHRYTNQWAVQACEKGKSLTPHALRTRRSIAVGYYALAGIWVAGALLVRATDDTTGYVREQYSKGPARRPSKAGHAVKPGHHVMRFYAVSMLAVAVLAAFYGSRMKYDALMDKLSC